MGGIESIPTPRETRALEKVDTLEEKHPSSHRPGFLDVSSQQLDESKDHETRPILSPSDGNRLPWNCGYAETINAGKSFHRNEDQASYAHEIIRYRDEDQSKQEVSIPVWFFGVFDGHAGGGASMYSSHICHQRVLTNLYSIRELLTRPDRVIQPEEDFMMGSTSPPIDVRDLIKGALEQAFFDVDDQIREDRMVWRISGGCTALVSLFIDQTLYVANAGDCRAIIIRDGEIVEMSMDFTPETDRQRIQAIAFMQPQLLGDFFGRLQFQRRIRSKDIGNVVLCRDKHMTGWAYKEVEDEDVKRMPMVQGEGKRARLLATIATTRGFGDNDLEAPGGLYIKPFLTPMPEIRLYDLTDHESLSHDDVLVVASDGLWERLTNEEARDLVMKSLQHESANDRYTKAARNLVQSARGQLTSKGWRTERDELASGDDITCFVIPLKKAGQHMSATTYRRDKTSSPSSTSDEATTSKALDAPHEKMETEIVTTKDAGDDAVKAVGDDSDRLDAAADVETPKADVALKVMESDEVTGYVVV